MLHQKKVPGSNPWSVEIACSPCLLGFHLGIQPVCIITGKNWQLDWWFPNWTILLLFSYSWMILISALVLSSHVLCNQCHKTCSNDLPGETWQPDFSSFSCGLFSFADTWMQALVRMFDYYDLSSDNTLIIQHQCGERLWNKVSEDGDIWFCANFIILHDTQECCKRSAWHFNIRLGWLLSCSPI